MAKVRFGLIGVGRWGRNYLRTIAGIEEAVIARVASTNPETARLAQCPIDADWRRTIAAPDVDAVIIATPPATHKDIAVAALAAGRNVLIEKPLTLDLGEAKEIRRAAEAARRLAWVEHTQLFHPAYRALKQLARSLGPVRAIRAFAGDRGPWRTDTPLLWDRGSHDVALCLDFLGELPEAIRIQRLKVQETGDGGIGESLALDMVFPGDVDARIRLDNLLERKTRRFAVHFDDAVLVFDDMAADKLTLHPRRGSFADPETSGEPISVSSELPLTVAVREFAVATAADATDLDGINFGVAVVATLERAQDILDKSTIAG